MINDQYCRYYPTVYGYMLDICGIYFITVAIHRFSTAEFSGLAPNRIGPVNLHSLLEYPWCCMSMMDCIVNPPGWLPFLPPGSFLCTYALYLFLANTACSSNNSKITDPNRKTSRENVEKNVERKKRRKKTSKENVERKTLRENVERKRREKTLRENVERKRRE